MTVANSVSMSHSIARRYAQAVFDLAREEGQIDPLAAQTEDLAAALDGSPELRDLISSPIYARDDQARAIGTLAARMNLAPVLANTLQLMARNRRLFVLPQFARALADLIAIERGEVTAEVTSAAPLTDAQQEKLKATLAQKSGKTVKLNTRVDEALIGGMIVKLGSQMIDSSVRSKLASLQNVMKEVG